MIKNYLKSALRNIFRNKVYSAINIVGLSIGLACVMLIILFTRDEMSFDRFHEKGNDIYRVVIENRKADGSVEMKMGSTGYLQGPRFKDALPEITSFLRFRDDYRDMKRGADVKSQQIFVADSNFFTFFTFPLLKGDPKTVLLQPNSIVITEDVANQFFGTTDAIGKVVEFKDDDKFQPYQVTGVAKNPPINSSIRFGIVARMQIRPEEINESMSWFNSFQNTFIRLAPTASPAETEKRMHSFFMKDAATAIALAKQQYNFTNTYVHHLQPYEKMHLDEEFGFASGVAAPSKPLYTYILSGIAIFILLIACINFVNLTVARSVKRAKEIGVRKVIGGSRKQLITQFLGESFLLCSFSFLLAILITQLLLPTFNYISNKSLALSYLFDAKLVMVYIGLFVLTSLLAGFYPAMVLSGFNPVKVLYGRFSGGRKGYLQKGLVVFQFALASLMITITLIVYLQFRYLNSKDLGYNDKNVVMVGKWGMKQTELDYFRAQLTKNPNIVAVAAKNLGTNYTRARINGTEEVDFAVERIDEEYLPLMDIKMATGRNFSRQFPSDSSHSVIVNEAFVKKAGWKDPLGQTVDFWYNNKKYSVVGVVKDYHFESLSQQIIPQLFTCDPEKSLGRLMVRIKPGTEPASLAQISALFKQVYPLSPYDYQFKSDENADQYKQESKWRQMMFFGAMITIFISCIGLFGLSVLAAERRTKEIGIRKVLGASVAGLASSLSKDFLKLVVIAMVIAIPVAWLLAGKWLSNYASRIQLSWWIFGVAAIIVVMLAIVTISFQSIKAALSNPIRSLRSE